MCDRFAGNCQTTRQFLANFSHETEAASTEKSAEGSVSGRTGKDHFSPAQTGKTIKSCGLGPAGGSVWSDILH